MGVGYQPVLWNRQKKRYDLVMLLGIVCYLAAFVIFTLIFYSTISVETLIIRAFGSLALTMLHIILMIGPLSRINLKFLPLLYNRRHLGVTMFLMAAVHGIFSIIQFHTFGNAFPLVSLFTSNIHYDSFVNFPFQVLGFFALIILFLMAATSHDFWLKNLSPRIWKNLHMMVYLAYALIVMHVMLGVAQVETSPLLIGLLGIGMMMIISLHLYAGWIQRKIDRRKTDLTNSGYIKVCHLSDIIESRAKIFTIGDQSIAVFKYNGKLSAVSNVCKHQGGPLGEGKLTDGCITCPWHGYQYLPENGQSPPPFEEKIATYQVQIIDEYVVVNPEGFAEGTYVEPCLINPQKSDR